MFGKSTQLNTEKKLLGFMRNAGYKSPTLLQKAVLPLTLLGRDIVIEAGSGEGRTGLFLISLLLHPASSGNGISNLIVTGSTNEVHKVLRQYRRFTARHHGRPHIVGLGTSENMDRELRILAGNPDIVAGTSDRIIDHLRRKNITLDDVKNVVLVFPDERNPAGFHKDVLFIYSKLPGKCQTQAYSPSVDAVSELDAFLKRPLQVPKSDWCKVDKREEQMTENGSSKNANAQTYIKSVLKMIKDEKNPQELNEFRRIFRKNTPLHLRAYFAAYLLKGSLGSAESSGGGFKTLFVSVGRSRKVYPKDLKQLFIRQLGISDAEIGNVKILENYSFIDIAQVFAQKAIDALNATDFRGRKITVNYSRKKEDKPS